MCGNTFCQVWYINMDTRFRDHAKWQWISETTSPKQCLNTCMFLPSHVRLAAHSSFLCVCEDFFSEFLLLKLIRLSKAKTTPDFYFFKYNYLCKWDHLDQISQEISIWDATRGSLRSKMVFPIYIIDRKLGMKDNNVWFIWWWYK